MPQQVLTRTERPASNPLPLRILHAVPMLELAQDEGAALRVRALWALHGMAGFGVSQGFVENLDHANAAVREAALHGLHWVAARDPMRWVHALCHRDAEVRARAIQHLPPTFPRGWLPALVPMSQEEARRWLSEVEMPSDGALSMTLALWRREVLSTRDVRLALARCDWACDLSSELDALRCTRSFERLPPPIGSGEGGPIKGGVDELDDLLRVMWIAPDEPISLFGSDGRGRFWDALFDLVHLDDASVVRLARIAMALWNCAGGGARWSAPIAAVMIPLGIDVATSVDLTSDARREALARQRYRATESVAETEATVESIRRTDGTIDLQALHGLLGLLGPLERARIRPHDIVAAVRPGDPGLFDVMLAAEASPRDVFSSSTPELVKLLGRFLRTLVFGPEVHGKHIDLSRALPDAAGLFAGFLISPSARKAGRSKEIAYLLGRIESFHGAIIERLLEIVQETPELDTLILLEVASTLEGEWLSSTSVAKAILAAHAAGERRLSRLLADRVVTATAERTSFGAEPIPLDSPLLSMLDGIGVAHTSPSAPMDLRSDLLGAQIEEVTDAELSSVFAGCWQQATIGLCDRLSRRAVTPEAAAHACAALLASLDPLTDVDREYSRFAAALTSRTAHVALFRTLFSRATPMGLAGAGYLNLAPARQAAAQSWVQAHGVAALADALRTALGFTSPLRRAVWRTAAALTSSAYPLPEPQNLAILRALALEVLSLGRQWRSLDTEGERGDVTARDVAGEAVQLLGWSALAIRLTTAEADALLELLPILAPAVARSLSEEFAFRLAVEAGPASRAGLVALQVLQHPGEAGERESSAHKAPPRASADKTCLDTLGGILLWSPQPPPALEAAAAGIALRGTTHEAAVDLILRLSINREVIEAVLPAQSLQPRRRAALTRVGRVVGEALDRAHQVSGLRFSVKSLAREDEYGETQVGGGSRVVSVNPLPLLRGERHGEAILRGLILHEVGHHMYGGSRAGLTAMQLARAEGIGPLLNLVEDEFLERSLRALDPGIGDDLKKVTAHVFLHARKECDVKEVLRLLGPDASEILRGKALSAGRAPGTIRLSVGEAMARAMPRHPFVVFMRHLRMGLGARHADPLVAAGLALFSRGFRRRDPAGRLEVARALRQIFTLDADLLRLLGLHAAMTPSDLERLGDGLDLSGDEIREEITRIHEAQGQPRGRSGGGGRVLNLAPEEEFDRITEVHKLPFDGSEWRNLALAVAPHASRLRRYFARLGSAPVRRTHLLQGRSVQRSLAQRLITHGDRRVLRRHEERPAPDLFVGMLVDCSSSMRYHDHMDRARLFAALLASAMAGFRSVDLRIFGFTDDTIYDAGDANRPAIAALSADGGNNDAAALWHAAAVAQQSRRRCRLLLMISDGLPSSCSVDALRAVVRQLHGRGRTVCAQVAVAELPPEGRVFPHYIELQDTDVTRAVPAFGQVVERLVGSALRRAY